MVKQNCDLSKENRIIINTVKENINSIKTSVEKIEKSNGEMFNHFTERYESMFERLRSRVPVWVTIITTTMSSALAGLIVLLITL